MVQTVLIFIHLLTTAVMFGIVWFVQIIHYPLFAFVDDGNFAVFEKEHIRLTKFLIMPAMLIELATAVLLVIYSTEMQMPFLWTNLLLLGIIWASTMFIQVPLHSALTGNKDEKSIRKLVSSNWIRTAAWTIRLVLLLWIIVF